MRKFGKRDAYFSMIAMISSSRMTIRSSPSTFTSLPGILAEQDQIAGLDVQRPHVAVFQQLAPTHRHHRAARGLLGGGARQDDAARTLLVSSSTRLISTRSCSGRMFIDEISWGFEVRGLEANADLLALDFSEC